MKYLQSLDEIWEMCYICRAVHLAGPAGPDYSNCKKMPEILTNREIFYTCGASRCDDGTSPYAAHMGYTRTEGR